MIFLFHALLVLLTFPCFKLLLSFFTFKESHDIRPETTRNGVNGVLRIRRVVDDFLFPCHPLTVLIAYTSMRRRCVPDVWRVPEFQAESALQSCEVPDNHSKAARHPVSSERFHVWRYYVTKAYFSVMTKSAPTTAASILLKEVLGSWSSQTITYNNAPSLSDKALDYQYRLHNECRRHCTDRIQSPDHRLWSAPGGYIRSRPYTV